MSEYAKNEYYYSTLKPIYSVSLSPDVSNDLRHCYGIKVMDVFYLIWTGSWISCWFIGEGFSAASWTILPFFFCNKKFIKHKKLLWNSIFCTFENIVMWIRIVQIYHFIGNSKCCTLKIDGMDNSFFIFTYRRKGSCILFTGDVFSDNGERHHCWSYYDAP